MRRLRDNQYFHLGMMILTVIAVSITGIAFAAALCSGYYNYN